MIVKLKNPVIRIKLYGI